MPAKEDQEPGIDKQKVIRALDETVTDEAAEKAVAAAEAEEGPRGPSWLTYLRAHSDEVSSLIILAAALTWIIGGMLAGSPIPVLVGAILLLPGMYALSQSFHR